MDENPLQIGEIDTPSPFDMAMSVLKQPLRLPDLPFVDDPYGGFDEQRVVEVGTSEALLDTNSSLCSFGGIVNNDDPTNNRAILGGAITCGDQNFNVANYPFPVDAGGSADGEWLVEISINGITFNTDDDDSLILSGIETATGTPTWNKIAYTGSENYTSNTNPTTPTGTGTVVLPVGLLTVSGVSTTFDNTGCGAFLVGQCAGVLSYSRLSSE